MNAHLTDGELLELAAPPVSAPEAVSPHLAACPRCARQLAEWKKAMADLAGRNADPPAGFEAAVMARVRAAGLPGKSRGGVIRWAAVAAALVAAFVLAPRVRVASIAAPAAAMTAADRADDQLLRDVSRLVTEEDRSGWGSLVPTPSSQGGRS